MAALGKPKRKAAFSQETRSLAIIIGAVRPRLTTLVDLGGVGCQSLTSFADPLFIQIKEKQDG
jgi:hypothetical protein